MGLGPLGHDSYSKCYRMFGFDVVETYGERLGQEMVCLPPVVLLPRRRTLPGLFLSFQGYRCDRFNDPCGIKYLHMIGDDELIFSVVRLATTAELIGRIKPIEPDVDIFGVMSADLQYACWATDSGIDIKGVVHLW